MAGSCGRETLDAAASKKHGCVWGLTHTQPTGWEPVITSMEESADAEAAAAGNRSFARCPAKDRTAR